MPYLQVQVESPVLRSRNQIVDLLALPRIDSQIFKESENSLVGVQLLAGFPGRTWVGNDSLHIE